MSKICAAVVVCVLAGAVGCGGTDDRYDFDWAFDCPDGTYFICRAEGYFHCDGPPPTSDPGPSCTLVSPTCTSNPSPGESEAQAACRPSCTAITVEADCLARPACTASYEGLDCTNPDGTACGSGETDCTCASFEFVSCESQPS